MKKIIINTSIFIGFAFCYGFVENSLAQGVCPTPPVVNGLQRIEYNPLDSHPSKYSFSVDSSKSYANDNIQGQRHITIYKQAYGSETDIKRDGTLGNVVAYNIDPKNGSHGLNSTNSGSNFDFAQFGLPAWRPSSLSVNDFDTVYGSVSHNQAASGNFELIISPGQAKDVNNAPLNGLSNLEFVVYTYYDDGTDISCTSLYGGNKFAVKTHNFQLAITPYMAMSLSGTGTKGNIDFGQTIATNATKSVNINLRANNAYKVTMDSAYGGYLKLNNSAASTEQIRYTAKLGNSEISETVNYSSNSGTQGSGEATLPFEITIGDTSSSRAGYYKDIVTLTISPL